MDSCGCRSADAFEAKGRRVALIAYGKCRIREAMLLRGYTADLTVPTLGREMELPEDEERAMHDAGIKIVRHPIVRLERIGGDVAAWPEHAQRRSSSMSCIPRWARDSLRNSLSSSAPKPMKTAR
jgi:hypothetical protein